ncbi:MAG: isoprenyl transferase [Planctomycetia bacterium]|nr:isoprenyl transferase [Planctomycetia bacterium]
MDKTQMDPEHIAIIMDGNGRWAQQRGLSRSEGHRAGAETVRRIVEESVRLGLRRLTLYCFSQENWKRPPLELEALMFLLRQFMVSERDLLQRQNVRLEVIGRRDGIPQETLREMDESVRLTAQNSGLTLCLAINYGGRQEIVDAARRLALLAKEGTLDPNDIDEQLFARHLYTRNAPDPDLLIRTAGELRLSNFLLWQLSYAELWVTQKFWPEFDVPLFHEALAHYRQRERRFGGLS